MAFTKLTKDMNIIQKLDDEPNDVGGLTSAELKAKFDEPANAVKDWINNTFIPEAEEALNDARLESLPKHAHLHATNGADPITPSMIGAYTVAETDAALQLKSNPNLLDNWYFPDPINQRGQTEYTTAGYTIDRWKMDVNGAVVLTDNGINVKMNNSTYGHSIVRQVISDCEVLIGKQVVLSILTTSGLTSAAGVIPTSGYSNIVSYGSNKSYARIWLTGARIIVEFICVSDNDPDIVAVKLELGSVQTLAHQDSTGAWVLNDPPPNKQQELAKCMRYQIVLCNLAEAGSPAFVGMGTSTGSGSAVFINCPVPEPLRGVPSVIHAGIELMSANLSTYFGVGEITVYPSYAKNMVTLSVTPNSAVTGNAAFYLVGRYAGSKLILDANL